MGLHFSTQCNWLIKDFGQRRELVELYLNNGHFSNYDSQTHTLMTYETDWEKHTDRMPVCEPVEFSRMFPDVVMVGDEHWGNGMGEYSDSRYVLINGCQYRINFFGYDFPEHVVYADDNPVCTIFEDDQGPILHIKDAYIRITNDIAHSLSDDWHSWEEIDELTS